MNYKELLVQKLKYNKNSIIITYHAREQALFRGIALEEVKENIINPKRLVYAEKQRALEEGEEKYNCYFAYRKTQCHRYVIVVNKICIVCTIIKINRRWQRIVEKK